MFLITSMRLLHIITFYYMLVLYTRTHTKDCHYNFLLEFRNCPCNRNFLPLFPSAYKTLHIYATVITKPLFAQNAFGLILALCIVFIAGFFPWLYVEKFQGTEIRQFCLRLWVIGRSAGIIIKHAVNDVFSYILIKLKCWKTQKTF